MLLTPEMHAQLVRERVEREIALARLWHQARQPSRPIRQVIGRWIIQIGARLAAEPSLTSVRSH